MDSVRVNMGALWSLPILLLLGCTSPDRTSGSDADPTSGSEDEVVVSDLAQPTQFETLPDGRLLIAQLNGTEEGSTGQVLVVNTRTDERAVLVSQLDKPTGVAYLDGTIWIMTRRGLVKSAWSTSSAEAAPVISVLSDLPFNGRSQGTLTKLDVNDGSGARLIYETSGDDNMTNAAGKPTAGSGKLWAFSPRTLKSTAIAAGLKNGYAHTVLDDGRLITTEISAENSDPPPDELHVIDLKSTPPNFGWPNCPPGSDTTATECAGVEPATVLLPKNSTPTGIARIGKRIYVALWFAGEIRRIDLTNPAKQSVIRDDLDAPQHLEAQPDGSLLVSEHNTGRILRMTVS
jgi:glucose/arabinose dehydrogenase